MDIESLFPGNAAVNMLPQQWVTVFSVVSVLRSYKNKRRYSSVLSSKFSVENSHGNFVDLWSLKVCVIQWDCYSSCVLVVVPGEDQCLCKSAIALYCVWLKELVTEVPINKIIRTRTRHFRHAYHPTRDNIMQNSCKTGNWKSEEAVEV
jgi:hypothetical protein